MGPHTPQHVVTGTASEALRTGLNALADGERWLEIGGPPGAGKSVLAARLCAEASTAGAHIRLLDEPPSDDLARAWQDASSPEGAQWVVVHALGSGRRGVRILLSGLGDSAQGSLTASEGVLTSLLSAEGVGVDAAAEQRVVAALVDAVGGNPAALGTLAPRARWLGLAELASALHDDHRLAELLFAPGDGPLTALRQSMGRIWEQLGADARAAFLRLSVCAGPIDVTYAAGLPVCGPQSMQALADAGLVRRQGDCLVVDRAARLYALWAGEPTCVEEAQTAHDAWVGDQFATWCLSWIACGDGRARSQLLALEAEAFRTRPFQVGTDGWAAATVARSCIHRVRGKFYQERQSDAAGLRALIRDPAIEIRARMLAVIELAWHARDVGGGADVEPMMAPLAAAIVDPIDLGLWHKARYLIALSAQDYATAVEVAQKCTELSCVASEPLWKVAAQINLGVALQWAGEAAEASEAYERALTLAERYGDRGLQVLATSNLASAEMQQGRGERARGLCAEAHRLACANDDLGTVASMELHWGMILHHLGHPAEAVEHYKVAAGRIASLDMPVRAAMVHAHLGDAYTSLGDLEQADTERQRAERLQREFSGYAGDRLGGYIELIRIHLMAAQGRRRQLLAHLASGPPGLCSVRAAGYQCDARLFAVAVALRQGEVETAHELLAQVRSSASARDRVRSRVLALLDVVRSLASGGRQETVAAEMAVGLRSTGAPRRHNNVMLRRVLDELAPLMSDSLRATALMLACAEEVAVSETVLGVVTARRTAMVANRAPVDLNARPLLWRLLTTLARRHVSAMPPASVEDLTDALWPGESVLPAAAKNRVYNAVALLRKRGLKEVIEQGPAGYALARHIRVAQLQPAAWHYVLDAVEGTTAA